MKKIDKKDLLSLIILSISFLIFFFILVNTKYYYGSVIDWYEQHIAFPEYFRNLFYKTKDLFPDFAFNIGSGQNIYNYAYYGYLSPIILVSYLLPFISMTNYLIISTIICIIISSYLIYFFLKKKGFKQSTCFLCSFLYLFSSPLTFHSHRHIMFVNYMPFLIMGLYGVEQKLDKNKSLLLALSVFLMVMTSYYFSIPGIICLVLYGIYKYIGINNKITIKNFIKDGINFVAPMLIGILMSSIVILPTFQVILSSRGETYNTITLLDLLLPSINTETIIYKSYGIGLTSIVLISIINLFFNKEKNNKYLAILLSLIVVFPIFSYILNATMYIDAKALIPLLPLCILSIAIFINDLDNIDYKKLLIGILIVSLLAIFNESTKIYFYIDVLVMVIALLVYKKYKKEKIIIITTCIIAFIASLSTSSIDGLVLKEKDIQTPKTKEAIDYITQVDKDYYRISNKYSSNSSNKTYNNIKYFNSTLYSSTSNKDYNEFYYDVMNNNIQSRNRAITSQTDNLLFNLFIGNKYLINKGKELQGYEYVTKLNDVYIYKTDNALPIGYATSNIMSYEDFESLNYPYQAEAILNNIVTDKVTSTKFVTNIKQEQYDLNKLIINNLDINKKDNKYIIKSNGKGTMTYPLEETYINKVLFLRVTLDESPKCSDGDIFITINGNKNKLTCEGWKYHNQNYIFDYVIADNNLKELNIKFNKGTFKISNIELYSLDAAYLENIKSNISALDISKMSNDTILGTINVKEDGYFTLSIPYDKGFKAYVDGKEVNIEKVNTAFMGFKISKGKHDIKFTYSSPLKNIGIILSIVGTISLILVCYIESKQKL